MAKLADRSIYDIKKCRNYSHYGKYHCCFRNRNHAIIFQKFFTYDGLYNVRYTKITAGKTEQISVMFFMQNPVKSFPFQRYFLVYLRKLDIFEKNKENKQSQCDHSCNYKQYFPPWHIPHKGYKRRIGEYSAYITYKQHYR